MNRPGLLFWCQHSVGLGHLARSLLLAAGLAGTFDVVLLNGGRRPAGLRVPDGVTVVDLPLAGEDDPRRLRLLLDELDRVDPEVLLVELYPFGRRQFAHELEPLLDAAHARPRPPRVVCSLRDILVTQRHDQAAHDERAAQRVNRAFDAVLVHSDPRFARLEETFQPATPLRVPVHHTGFVAPPARDDARGAEQPRLLVSSGGGMVGESLVRSAVAVHAELRRRTGLTTTVVAGPFLPETVWQWLRDVADRSPDLHAVCRVDDLCDEMRRSTVSLSQAGYNTCMDLLRSGTRAVVVPYEEGREDEQRRRTGRLQELGLVRAPAAPDPSDDELLELLCAAAVSPPVRHTLDLDGQAASARLLAGMVGR